MTIDTIISAHPELLLIIVGDENEMRRSETNRALLLGTQRECAQQLHLLDLEIFHQSCMQYHTAHLSYFYVIQHCVAVPASIRHTWIFVFSQILDADSHRQRTGFVCIS